MVEGQGSWLGASDGNVCSGEAIPATLGQGYAGPSLHPQPITLLGLHTHTHTHTQCQGPRAVKSVKGA